MYISSYLNEGRNKPSRSLSLLLVMYVKVFSEIGLHWVFFPLSLIRFCCLFRLILFSFLGVVWGFGVTLLFCFRSRQAIYVDFMMTSSNEYIFRATGPLCGEFTGNRWTPLTKASDAELWCFLLFASEVSTSCADDLCFGNHGNYMKTYKAHLKFSVYNFSSYLRHNPPGSVLIVTPMSSSSGSADLPGHLCWRMPSKNHSHAAGKK